MSGVTSDEVALDFKDSLSDLQMNNRYEISNLTIIAKENIEHAQALSKALETHIRTTAPSRKLPALYTLDSIAKNVGSPYTIYLGRNLFSTFMDAYTLVDPNVRRSMESMLRTWKEPVPGSMEPTPVFPPETTRVIEAALTKAKAFQSKQTAPPRAGLIGNRNTPTPPQQAQRYGAPPQPSQHNGYGQGTPQPPIDAQALLAALSRPPQDDTVRLNADIENLINTARSEFARNPFDSGIQQRLKALLDLQNLMRTQQLPPEALAAIRSQVAGLSAAARPSSAQGQHTAWQPPAPTQTPVPPPNLAQLLHHVPSSQPPPSVPGSAPPPIFAPGALEALMASTANGQKPSTPQLRQALPNLTNLPGAGPTSDPSANSSQAQSLIDALRSAGLASSNSTPAPPPPQAAIPLPLPPQATSSAADLLKALSGNPLLSKILTPPMPGPVVPAGPQKPNMPISQAALKTFRADVVATLYSALPNQCPTCALRFPATDAGRAAKASHLDWHFRLNQRVADRDGQHRGLHRMWFPDEMDWIRAREVDVSRLSAADEAAGAAAAAAAALGGAEGAKGARAGRKFTLAGKDKNQSCPICQEAFKAEWSEEAQDWVWMDTVEAGGRVYHTNCFEEVNRGGAGATAADAGAVGGVLGKRKAVDDGTAGLEALRAKLKA